MSVLKIRKEKLTEKSLIFSCGWNLLKIFLNWFTIKSCLFWICLVYITAKIYKFWFSEVSTNCLQISLYFLKALPVKIMKRDKMLIFSKSIIYSLTITQTYTYISDNLFMLL